MSDYVVVPVSIYAQLNGCYLGWDDDDWSLGSPDPIRTKQAKLELKSALDLPAKFLKQTGAVRIADHYLEDGQGPGFAWIVDRHFASTLMQMVFPTVDADGVYAQIPIRGDVATGLQRDPITWWIEFHSFGHEGPAAMSFIEIDECFDHLFGSMRDIYDFASTPERLPQSGETADEWAARVAVDGQALIDAMDLFERCGKDPQFYLALRPSAEETQFRFLVDGLFPFGVVSLVAGDGGVGKSTMLTELCAVVGSQSTDERTFLGQPVNERGICMFFSGEDNPSFLMERQEFYQRQGHANGSQCFLIGAAGLSLDECISMVRRYKDRVKLAVFDPASKFFSNSNDNDAIDPQIGKLDALAAETGCAVVLAHHLTKGRVQQFAHMRDKIRGAGAFVNRPRMVLGIMRKGADAARIVEIGILKHNIPPSQALWGELGKGRLFYQNPETLRLEPHDNGQPRQGRLPPAESSNNAALERWILDTVRQRVAAGGEVRKTGRKSLHQGQQETGGSYSRLAIERAQDSLIAAGLLLDTEAGLQICEPPLTE